MKFLIHIILIFIATAMPVSGQTTDDRRGTSDSLQSPVIRYPWPEYSAFQNFQHQAPEPGSLSLSIRSTAFFKNNEYKNSFIQGYSLSGIFAEPVLEYHPDAKTTIRGGAHLLKYYGRDNFDRILPVISIQHDVSEHFSMVFGTLNGTSNHGLIEPVQDFENYLINNYENGIQLLFNYPSCRTDIWLNWEQFIKKEDPFPEIFTIASNSDFRLFDWQGLRLTVPFSSMFRHTGGEIDTYYGPEGTRLNLVHGLRLDLQVTDPFFNSLYAIQNIVESIEINPNDYVTIPFGHGSYTRVGFETKIGNFEAGYWKSTDFNAPHGNPIFQSVSDKYPSYYQAGREMLVLKYQFRCDLTDYLRFAFRLEPYYHFDTGRIDHSWSVYLILDEGFLLSKGSRLKAQGSSDQSLVTSH
ncbi:MAG: hypothetical protein V2A67_08830 [Bacteroidota bacterium]